VDVQQNETAKAGIIELVEVRDYDPGSGAKARFHLTATAGMHEIVQTVDSPGPCDQRGVDRHEIEQFLEDQQLSQKPDNFLPGKSISTATKECLPGAETVDKSV